jgi:hypothetical protein
MGHIEPFRIPPHPPDSDRTAAIRPEPASHDVVRRFTRGKEHPRGVVWFGARSFWGHLRHFFAAAAATENIDSRDWMTPDGPRELMKRIIEVLGGDPRAKTLVEGLGRDLYIDFVADTGDDVAVSRAVARLVFASYELPDPDRSGRHLRTPRGEILLFGGDTAYPVATAQEIMNRVIAPWNEVLQSLPDDGRRVLLGVPGNHDWYDGLDGFRRMFRRRSAGEVARPSVTRISSKMLEYHAEWARKFVRGERVEKPEALALSGYHTVQNASYFAAPLAPGIDMIAVDRQLTTTDSRQTEFLRGYYDGRQDSATFAVLPDPVYTFGDPSRTGTEMVEKLHLDLADRETFILSGDIHHYERIQKGKVLHVISGGGGAFLHPARIAHGGLRPDVLWPGAAQCRLLLRSAPLKLACGRSGFLPHAGLLIFFLLAYFLSERLYSYTGLVLSGSILMTLFVGGVYALIGGAVKQPKGLPIALAAAAVTVFLSTAGSIWIRSAFAQFGTSVPMSIMLGVIALGVGVFIGAFVFGAYLALLTLLGYENTQAFTVLDHPGFKNFVRLRVRADGQGIDGWCIGVVDPLGENGKPVLVDQFKWRPR